MKRIFTAFLPGLALWSSPIVPAIAQTTSCNLVSNGNFDIQKRTPSGIIQNVYSQYAPYNEDDLAVWEGANKGRPEYFATNAPSNTDVNPLSSYLGPFIPYANDPTPGAHNGCLALSTYRYYAGTNAVYSTYIKQQLPTALRGDRSYYASMQVYNASLGMYATPIGMDISTQDPADFTGNPNYQPPAPGSTYDTGTFTFSGNGIQSSGSISASQWTPVTGIFQGTSGARFLLIGNFQQSVHPQIRTPTQTPLWSGAELYVDNVELYEIPWGGPEKTIPCGSAVTVGEGCHIPGARYEWRPNGRTTVIANTLQATFTPTEFPAAYQLRVILPNGRSSVSFATIRQGTPPTPVITAQTREGFPIAQYGEVCRYKTLTFTVTGLSNVTWNVVAPSNPNAYQTAFDPNNSSEFKLKSFAPNFGGWRTETFYIEAYGTDICGNPGSTTFQFESQNADANGGICPNAEDELRAVGSPKKDLALAYPNPANESLTLPAGVTDAMLLNNQGRVVQQADGIGKLDVRSLPAGLYNLRMEQNGKVVNQHIEVKH